VRPIRLGLIGTGLAVEHLHWPALRQMPDRCTVTAFADRDVEQAARFATYSGVDRARFHTDHRDVLARDDVDAVLVSVPIPLLYGIARDALVAGRHVLCEKPTGTDEEQARAFLAFERDFPGQVVLVGENYFYRDDIRHARALLDDGAIGKLHLMSWRRAGQWANSTIDSPFADAVRHGRPVVGTVAQSVTNMRIVLAALDSAERAAVVPLDGPSEGGVPLWRPRGVPGLFDGLPGELEISEE
jgi:predicted dehydrogenase